MEKHTPEPWEVIDAWIADASGLESIAFVVSKKPAGLTLTEHDKANAARIVACVNACAGINPEAVPDLVVALTAMVGEFVSMNHDLRAVGKGRQDDGAHPYCPVELARAALAKAGKV